MQLLGCGGPPALASREPRGAAVNSVKFNLTGLITQVAPKRRQAAAVPESILAPKA